MQRACACDIKPVEGVRAETSGETSKLGRLAESVGVRDGKLNREGELASARVASCASTAVTSMSPPLRCELLGGHAYTPSIRQAIVPNHTYRRHAGHAVPAVHMPFNSLYICLYALQRHYTQHATIP
jgi:hypothetical protein